MSSSNVSIQMANNPMSKVAAFEIIIILIYPNLAHIIMKHHRCDNLNVTLFGM